MSTLKSSLSRSVADSETIVPISEVCFSIFLPISLANGTMPSEMSVFSSLNLASIVGVLNVVSDSRNDPVSRQASSVASPSRVFRNASNARRNPVPMSVMPASVCTDEWSSPAESGGGVRVGHDVVASHRHRRRRGGESVIYHRR